MDEGQEFLKYYGLIKFAIKKYYPGLVADEDVFQEASIGFLNALRTYTEDHNTVFTTYAVACITSAIKTYLKSPRSRSTWLNAVSFDDVFIDSFSRDSRSISQSRIIDTHQTSTDKEWEADFSNFFKKLNSAQKTMVDMRLQGYTLEEIGRKFGISRQRMDEKIHAIRSKYYEYIKEV